MKEGQQKQGLLFRDRNLLHLELTRLLQLWSASTMPRQRLGTIYARLNVMVITFGHPSIRLVPSLRFAKPSRNSCVL